MCNDEKQGRRRDYFREIKQRKEIMISEVAVKIIHFQSSCLFRKVKNHSTCCKQLKHFRMKQNEMKNPD